MKNFRDNMTLPVYEALELIEGEGNELIKRDNQRKYLKNQGIKYVQGMTTLSADAIIELMDEYGFCIEKMDFCASLLFHKKINDVKYDREEVRTLGEKKMEVRLELINREKQKSLFVFDEKEYNELLREREDALKNKEFARYSIVRDKVSEIERMKKESENKFEVHQRYFYDDIVGKRIEDMSVAERKAVENRMQELYDEIQLKQNKTM